MEDAQIDFLHSRTWIKSDEEGMKKVHEQRNMGSGWGHPVNNPKLIFTRKFRFIVTPESKPELYNYMNKVFLDYKNKTITLSIYDFRMTRNWLETKETSLKLETFDGCGSVMWFETFSGLSMDGHTLDFDYSDSDALKHLVTFKYEKVEREDVYDL